MALHPHPGPFAFGRCRLDPAARRLTRDGADLPVGPRALQLLATLVAQAGRVVTKDELHATVWGPVVVEDANLHVQVSQLRKLLGNDAIATVPRVGYRFMWPVTTAGAAASGAPTRHLSVIVLPFVEPTAPRGEEHFADAVTDDITTVLARMRGSHVICAQTAFRFRGAEVDVGALAAEMAVRYVLQGRIDRSASDLELNARLTEAATGAVRWSDRITVPPADLRRLRRELVDRLAAALDLALVRSEAEHAGAADGTRPDVVDLLMRGRALGAAAGDRAQQAAAVALFEAAWREDPQHPQTLVWRAIGRLILNHWAGPDVDTVLDECEHDLQQALRLDPSDGYVHHGLSHLHFQRGRIDDAIEANRLAVELVPGCVHVWTARATLNIARGRAELAFDDIDRASMVSPFDPQQWLMLLLRGRALVMLGRHAEALPWLERSRALTTYWGATLLLAAARARLGDAAGATEAWRTLQPADFEHLRWSPHRGAYPDFVRQRDEHVLRPLLDCGLIARPPAANDGQVGGPVLPEAAPASPGSV
jgi:TolB-like protein